MTIDRDQQTSDDTTPAASDRLGTAKLLSTHIALGLGRFRVKSEHEHRLDWERSFRR